MLVRQPSPNWLTANSRAHLHRLLGVLAPPDCQIRVGGCPWCPYEAAGWMHTLQVLRRLLGAGPTGGQMLAYPTPDVGCRLWTGGCFDTDTGPP